MDEKKIATLDLLSFEPRQCAGLSYTQKRTGGILFREWPSRGSRL
jgi:hypothetical protein